jgi:hypothetical protein
MPNGVPSADADEVRVFDSLSPAYQQAFHVFLNHTDQKVNARRWLERFVNALPARRVFVDAGAGNGEMTATFAPHFERTIAIEPSSSLRWELQQRCPEVELIAVGIGEAQPSAPADLVVCSHVLYYIDRCAWRACLAKMASWLAERGSLVVVLQNGESDCMRMLQRFLGQSFCLKEVALELEQEYGNDFVVERQLVPAQVNAPDVAAAYAIAEFMLNLLPMPRPPAKREVKTYLHEHFSTGDGSFRFSCDQDFLVVRRRG